MNRRGFSIAELLVTIGLAGIVMVVAFELLIQVASSDADAHHAYSDFSDFSTVRLKLGREVSGGEMRAFFFTGNGAVTPADTCSSCMPTGGDRSLGRMLVPFAGKCRDLTSDCGNSVALLFTSQRSIETSTVEALCFADTEHFVSLQNTSIGPLVSLIGPPNSSMFITDGAPTAIAVDTTSGAPLNSTCVQNIKSNFNNTIPAGPYYLYHVKPAIATAVTRGSCVCDSQLGQAVNDFPARLVTTDLYSLGLSPSAGGAYTFGLNVCTVNATGLLFNYQCNQESGFAIDGIQYAQLDEQFLFNDRNRPGVNWYSLNPAPDPALCTGDCAGMSEALPLRSAFPGESFETIDFTRFSLIKQEMIQKMRFQFRMQDGKLYSTDILF